MDRDAFLATVRAATRTADLPDAPVPPIGVGATPADVVEVFVERLEATDGIAHRVRAAETVATVAALADEYDVDRFLTWADGELPVPGVVSGLIADGRRPVPAETPRDRHDRRSHHERYRTVRFGVTGADAALAESGSIVLTHGRGRPRMASLIPLVHVAVVAASTVTDSLSAWAAGIDVASTANLVIITGPSRTGDIEMQLNLGVHGPKHLHVVVVEDR